MKLELKNIEKSFGDKKVLTGVSFTAEGGKAFGLLGRNGAGKTTSIRILMDVIQKLVDKGNTVIIIEHNLDVIKLADHIIDIGPEGGRGGGQVLATGTPEEVAQSKKGYTPRFLKEELERK